MAGGGWRLVERVRRRFGSRFRDRADGGVESACVERVAMVTNMASKPAARSSSLNLMSPWFVQPIAAAIARAGRGQAVARPARTIVSRCGAFYRRNRRARSASRFPRGALAGVRLPFEGSESNAMSA